MSARVNALAVDNLDLLHAIGDAGETTRADLARELDRDPSNVGKTVKMLREERLVDPERLSLTQDGEAVVRLLGPDGVIKAPGGFAGLRHDQIELDPDNEREIIDEAELEDLRASILLRGLLQPPLVTEPAEPGGLHRLIIGERRWLAIQIALQEGDWPPDRLIICKISAPLSPRDRALARMSENLQRADLHPLDEGRGFVALRDVHGLPTAEIAEEIGRSQKHVQDRIALVEKTSPEDQARMRLPKDDPNHLNYRDAREAMREHRPKPAVDVTDKEALVLLEVMARHVERPSSHPMYGGKAGWIELAQLPVGGAASSLKTKGFLDIEEPFGDHVFARVAQGQPDLGQWLANRTVTGLKTALYHARAEAITAFRAAELEREGRYATDWLNPKVEMAKVGSVTFAEALEDEDLDEVEDEEATPSPPVGERGPRSGSDEGSRSDPPPPAEPANPVRDAPTLADLTIGQETAMAEVCRAIEDHPEAGPQNAYVGARVYDYFNDRTATAQPLIFAGLIKVQPDAKRKGYLVCLTALGEAWRDAFTDEIGSVETYTTPWLSPPEGAPEAAAKPAGPLAPMLGDQFADQLREVGDDDAPDALAGVTDVPLDRQIEWLQQFFAIMDLTSFDRPIADAVLASLRSLELA